MPEDYRPLYERAAILWQEAAYGTRPMSSEQREEMRLYLSETERILYDMTTGKPDFG